MRQEQTLLDRLISPTVEAVAKREKSYFRKSEVVTAVIKNKRVADLLSDLRARHAAWKVDWLVMRYIEGRVSRELQRRDVNNIRIYECYAARERERRWMPLRAMTAQSLRAVMQATRTQARKLELKGENYEFFLDELEKLGETAIVNDVYDRAIEQIRAYRAGG